MARRYIQRTLETVLRRATSEFPAVILTGPRQSGKTTLLRHLFGEEYRYVSLEPPDIRVAATEDPRGFLQMHPPPVIFDEVQYAPILLPYVKERIDADRDRTGQYLLTGSQNLLLAEKITESLAGRAAMLRLLPLSRREAEGNPQAHLPWEPGEPHKAGSRTSGQDTWKDFLRGGIRNSWPTPGETSTYGMRATSRPTSNATSARSARWAICPSFRASSGP